MLCSQILLPLKNISTLMTRFLPLLFCCFFFSLKAQTYSPRRFHLEGIEVIANKMISTFDKGVLTVGEVAFQADNHLTFFQKIDSVGNLEFLKSYTCFNAEFSLQNVIQLPDSGFVAVGSMFNPMTNHFGAAIQRLSKNGTVVWQKTLTPETEAKTIARSIKFLSDSTLLIVGNVENNFSFATKLTTDGALVWGKTFQNGTAATDLYVLMDAAELSDSSLVLVGYKGLNSGQTKGLIFRLNDDATPIWTKRTTDYGIFTASESVEQSIYINNLGKLLKVNQLGLPVWEKRFFEDHPDNMWGPNYRLFKENDSTFIVHHPGFSVGQFARHEIPSGLTSTLSTFGLPLDLVPNGDGRYSLLTSGPAYGVKALMTRHFAVETQANFVDFTCYMEYPATLNTSIPLFNDENVTISNGMALDEAMMEEINGELVASFACIDFLGAVNEENLNSITLFPNPTNVLLQLSTPISNYEITNQEGRVMKYGFEFVNTIDVTDLKAGIYFLKTDSKVMKFIKN
ncbi:MAG: hypothetical protein RL264_1106 [Bacteroidota bacterium]|jgi:hypothetical protein